MMMILRIVTVWVVLCPWESMGFLTPLASSRQNNLGTLVMHQTHENQQDNDVTKLLPTTGGAEISARSARILLPQSLIVSSVLFGNSLAANAGIGSVVPFEVSLKENFPGALTNSVILLRLNSSLRKRGYFQNKAVVGTIKPSELGVMLAGQFAGRNFQTLEDSFSKLDDLVASADGKKRALVVFGPDVDISRDGEVGSLQGNKDIKSAEATLVGKLKGNLGGLDEITLLGGIIIHRSKTGGKDAGEDCFQAFSIKTLTKDGELIDLYDPVFGDLPTPRL